MPETASDTKGELGVYSGEEARRRGLRGAKGVYSGVAGVYSGMAGVYSGDAASSGYPADDGGEV